jgi:hypothetical protein
VAWLNVIWRIVRLLRIVVAELGQRLLSGRREFRAGATAALRVSRSLGHVRSGISGRVQEVPERARDRRVFRQVRHDPPMLAAMGSPIITDRTDRTFRLVRSRRPLRRWAAFGLVAVVAVSAAACSDDDTAASGDGETTTTASTTTTTQPSATDDPDAAFDAVEEVVLEATSLADRLFQDPTVVNEPDNDDLERFREIYTDDSPTPDGVEAQLRDLAERGQRGRPTPGGEVYREVAPYAFEVLDADTVGFDTCNQVDRQVVDAAGQVIETSAQIVFVAGTARRVDGIWRFEGLSNDLSRNNPIRPGDSRAGYCAEFVADDRIKENG